MQEENLTQNEFITLLVYAIIISAVVIFVIVITAHPQSIDAYKDYKFKTGDQPIIVDNTKKQIMIVTVTFLECYQNETQCSVVSVSTNRTEMGNVSKGEMRITKISGANVVY